MMTKAIAPTLRRRRAMAIGIVLSALGGVVGGQTRDDLGARVSYAPSADVEVRSDIVYARYGDRELRLDLYLPAQRGPEPIPGIVAVRGGGWRVGDKEGFAAIASALAERGIAAASIEYRVSGEASWPAAMNDTKAAVRWLRANAPTYGIDPDALGAIGGSAGAHLVALLATTHRMDELDGEGGNEDESNRIQAAVAMAVPSDLRLFASAGADGRGGGVATFVGAGFDEQSELWSLVSPIDQVHAKAAPLLLVHSETDRVVPFEHSVSLQRRYAEEGVPVVLVPIEDAPHAFWNGSRWFDETMDRAAGFFKQHLR